MEMYYFLNSAFHHTMCNIYSLA